VWSVEGKQNISGARRLRVAGNGRPGIKVRIGSSAEWGKPLVPVIPDELPDCHRLFAALSQLRLCVPVEVRLSWFSVTFLLNVALLLAA